MKTLFATAFLCLSCLTSCVFDSPFAVRAEIPVDSGLVGNWKEFSEDTGTAPKRAPERMVVMQAGENDYFVQYPTGDKAMSFRAFEIELGGKRYFQVQVIGGPDGPAKKSERKYNLFKLDRDGGSLSLRALDPQILGDTKMDTQKLQAAFLAHQADPKLFGEAIQFRRAR